MSVTTIVLLPSTEGNESVTGLPIRASGSFRTSGDYAATISTHLMTEGRLYIEASMDSQATNWFAIPFEVGVPYLEFPYQGGGSADQTISLVFKGNFTWVRARLDRSYVTTTLPNPLGYLSIELKIDGYTAIMPEPTAGGVSSSNSVQTVSVENVGGGSQIYASSGGTATAPNILLRSLMAGNGIQLAQDATSIRISRLDDYYPTTIVELTDVANAITDNAVAIGSVGALAFTSAAANDTALVFRDGQFIWVPVNDVGAGSIVFAVRQNGNQIVGNTNGLNFTGNAVTVTDVSGVATVNIKSSDDFVENVVLQYTPGSAGNLSSTSDFMVSKTPGVSVDVIDPINCIVAFTFTGRSYPPTAIALMGQVRQTNEFNYSNVNPGIGTRKVAGGGTAAAPTLMGAFTGPITLQIRMTDTGASAPAGTRARAIVMFRF